MIAFFLMLLVVVIPALHRPATTVTLFFVRGSLRGILNVYWTIAASTMLVLCGLLAIGACWVAVRGLGGISALRIGQKELEAGLERIDERITREVKGRAGRAAAEKALDERTLLEQAQAELTLPAPVTPLHARPSRLLRRK